MPARGLNVCEKVEGGEDPGSGTARGRTVREKAREDEETHLWGPRARCHPR